MAANRRYQDQFQLRLPPGLRERIKAVAEANERSMNAEIVATLEETYPPIITVAETIERLNELLSDLSEENSEMERSRRGFRNFLMNLIDDGLDPSSSVSDAMSRLQRKLRGGDGD